MMKEFTKVVAVGVVAAGGFALILDYAFSMPTVYESFSSRQCVKVENYPGVIFGKTAFSCENLPETYDHVWVE